MNARDEHGQVTVFVTVFVLALIVVGGLVIDGGYVLAARRRAINEADGAARAGAEALSAADLRRGAAIPDPDRATAAAHEYLSRLGHDGDVEVSNGHVIVTVQIEQPLMILGIGGLADVTVTGHGEARAVRGVNEEVP
jgi:Flp pilus assembly protein TadG